jgi:hypothetical protein
LKNARIAGRRRTVRARPIEQSSHVRIVPMNTDEVPRIEFSKFNGRERHNEDITTLQQKAPLTDRPLIAIAFPPYNVMSTIYGGAGSERIRQAEKQKRRMILISSLDRCTVLLLLERYPCDHRSSIIAVIVRGAALTTQTATVFAQYPYYLHCRLYEYKAQAKRFSHPPTTVAIIPYCIQPTTTSKAIPQ